MAAAPEGTITLLFTDIAGSTRLLREAGEGYTDLLLTHRRLLREAFAAVAFCPTGRTSIGRCAGSQEDRQSGKQFVCCGPATGAESL